MNLILMALYRRALIREQKLYGRYTGGVLVIHPVTKEGKLDGGYPLTDTSNKLYQRVKRWA